MGCLGECWDVGPPPDSILSLPPPPIPAFLQHPISEVLLNATSCTSAQLCESIPASNRIPDGGDYMEMPRKDVESWSVSSIDDTWLLVLVASSIGVLLLGALLAMFLLKCREMHMFENNDCSRDHHQTKTHPEPRECSSVSNLNLNSNKLVHPTDAVMYHTPANIQDNRMVWAALTPHGTQHFVSENYPRDLIDYGETEDHYEAVDNLNIQPVLSHHPYYYKGLTLAVPRDVRSFDNSGFVDYDYEDPTPLIENYQLENRDYAVLGNTDMRCASLAYTGNTLRRGLAARPRVSEPTRIEHPNLPPLNLYPHKTNTLKRNAINYRNVDTGTLPKYGQC